MKKIFCLLFGPLSLSVFSQSISVKEGNEKFSVGSQNAAITVIFENNADNVISAWKKVLKDFKNEKVKDNDNEVFGDNILIKDWGNNPVDFYTKFEEDKKDHTVKMMTAVDLGGTYLSSSGDKDKYKYLEKMVKEFAIKMTKEPIEDGVKEQTKQLEKLEEKQKDLEKDKQNLQEDIVNYKNKINKAEKELIEKRSALEKKKDEVHVQRKIVDVSSEGVNEQAKSSKKILDKLSDQQNDLEKDVKELEKDIKNYEGKIKDAEKDINTNDGNQIKKKKEIEDQQKVVDNWKKKLDKVN